MFSKQSRLTHFMLAICFSLATLPAFGQNVSYQGRTKVIAFSRAENVKELYVAVIGEINRPGTYHLDPSTLNLHAVIRRAGGLTVDASPAIHVVRQGRIHQERYSENNRGLLRTGDLLIVESSQTKNSTGSVLEFDRQSATVNASFEQEAPQAGVQVALLNVLDYPLVLTLRPDEATIGQIVEQLGQGPEALPHLHIVSPDFAMRSIPDHQKAAIRLTGGSAIVFDKGVINRSRLPNGLPRPIESEIAQGAQSSLIGHPTGQSAELRSLGEKAFQHSSGSQEWHSLTSRQATPEQIQQATPEINVPAEEVKVDAQKPAIKLRPRIATIPFTGDPQISNSSTRQPDADRPAQELIPLPDESAPAEVSPPLTIAPSLSIEEEAAETTKPSPFPAAQLIVVFAILAAMVGMAVMVRRQQPSARELQSFVETAIEIEKMAQATVIDPTPPAATVPPKTKLEQLIKNELPITFEAVVFPEGLALQGRLAPKPILRVDDPQDVVKQNGPHFGQSEQESTGYSLQEMIAQLDTPHTETVRRPHFMGTRQPEIAAAAAPAATQAGPIAEVERPHAPLAKALFELEQGGRS